MEQGTNEVRMLQKSNAGEIIHIFEVMKKHGVKCGLDFQSAASTDPLFGFTYQPVTHIEYFGANDGSDSVLIDLGDTEFNFELGVNSFAKDISDCQITICISSEAYAAWFNSDVVPLEGIEEANNYIEHDPDLDEDKEIHLDTSLHEDFEHGIEWLVDCLQMGMVVKKSVVLGDGKQVLTIGFIGEESV